MPVYEYECAACGRRYRKLVGMLAVETQPVCPRCASADSKRLISRFARARGEEETMDELAEQMESADGVDDPRAMRRLIREVGKELDEDLEGDYEEMMDESAGTNDAGPAIE